METTATVKATPVALITGGAKRVGRAIAHRLATTGFDIALTYLSSESAAQDVIATITQLGRRAHAIRADLTQPESAAQTIFDSVSAQFGRLDVLVNNASLYEQSTLQSTSADQMRRLFAIHAESPLLLARYFEHYLRAAHGHIINMVDLLAEKPWPQYLAYCASKAALANLTLGLARELAPQVTVNAIAPGVVEWPPGYPEQEREKYLKRVPLSRAGTPEDVANLVHFLASTGSYITGQILRLDGGRSIT